MFQGWGFLLSEIWILLALAAMLGLLAGWIIWGRSDNTQAEDALQDKLNACRVELNTYLARSTPAVIAAASASNLAEEFDGDGIFTGTNEGTRPEALSGPRGGIADDLKVVKGIGNKMEKLCNSLGFYHFDQIANWNTAEVAWVDANLEGFRGRVTRDEWVSQAKVLAAGGSTDFAQKVSKGDVKH
jgi:predicted flap endonuclease-1-like 5' DNA nuclease